MIEKEEIIKCYSSTESLKRTAKECGVSYQTVRRVLASVGIYASEMTEEINERYLRGDDPEDIALSMKISVRSVWQHLPHSRCSYAVGEKTENAKKIADWRRNNK